MGGRWLRGNIDYLIFSGRYLSPESWVSGRRRIENVAPVWAGGGEKEEKEEKEEEEEMTSSEEAGQAKSELEP